MRKETQSIFIGIRILFCLLLPTGCNFYDPHGKVILPPTKTNNATATSYSWIKSEVLGPRCLSCHTGATARNHRIDLSTYESTVDPKNLTRGNPDESLIFQKVRDDEMPPDEPLPQSEKDWMLKWIKEGANP